MANKKKAYRRFEELTKRAMAPGSEVEPDRDSTNLQTGGEDPADGSPPPEEYVVMLSVEVRRALELRAAADKTTPSQVAEEALRRHLEIRRRRFT